jgi:hypothetical protein
MFLVCLAACVIVSLLGEPDDMEVLKEFYRKTRPWGVWKPVLLELQKDCPDASGNKDFTKDITNIIVGLIWHTSLTAAPIFMVIEDWSSMTVACAIAIVCSWFLKKNWWNKLSDYPTDLSEQKQGA